MRNVLNIVPYQYLPFFSGGQKLIAHFNQFLGKECVLHVAGTADNQPQGNESYTFHPLLCENRWRYADITCYFRLKRLIRKDAIDTVIIEHPYLGWLGFLLKSTCGVKLIYHTHNAEFERFRTIGKKWWYLLQLYEGWSLRQADSIFCISAEDRDLFIRKLGVPEEKCSLVPYGIIQQRNPENKNLLKEAICSRHGLDSRKKLLFFNGLLDYQPNTLALRQIIESINPLLQQSGLAYEILIAGKRLPASFNNLTEWNKENIHYAGFVDDIDSYTAAADLLLNPVLTGGGVKTKMIEAIGLDTSVVSTTTGAAGIDPSLCGEKLRIVSDKDWKSFCAAIIETTAHSHHTPDTFYQHYYWGAIIRRIIG